MQSTEHIPGDLREAVERELQPDERISWIEMPIPTFFTPKSKKFFPFGIVWTLFVVFWICAAAGFATPQFKEASDPFQVITILFPLFGVPFLLIGIGMLLFPIFEYRKALKTVYAITDRRAITLEAGWSRKVRSFPSSELANVYRKEKRNGTGDVIITIDKKADSEGNTIAEPLGFLRIREPKAVERMLKELAGDAGMDGSIEPSSESVIQGSEGPFGTPGATLNQDTLPQSRASTRIGKVIVVLALSILFGWFFNESSLENYQKGRTLTLDEYIEGFEEHKAQLLYHSPLWQDILIFFVGAGFFLCVYEFLGRGIGWVLWRTILKRKGPTGPWTGESGGSP
jgi:hypothetical protein